MTANTRALLCFILLCPSAYATDGVHEAKLPNGKVVTTRTTPDFNLVSVKASARATRARVTCICTAGKSKTQTCTLSPELGCSCTNGEPTLLACPKR
ncbi:hypothetical protein ACN469_11950 [Corallococcus terminator]